MSTVSLKAWLAGTIIILPMLLAAVPVLPNIDTNNIVVITNSPYQASTNSSDNAAAIQAAINASAAGATTNGAAGGTVRIPAGVFLSGPLTFKSSVNLQLDAGAVLRMLPFGQWPGSTNANGASINLLGATNLTDIAISGAGTIDGQGQPWWNALETNSSFLRPILIRFQGCNRQLIQGVTLTNSPMFNISVSSSKGNVTVQNVTILAPSSSASPASHNTDACDVSGTNILVQNCVISVGDDDFTCSGGTSGIVLTNNTYGNGHGVSIGSYTDGGVSNMVVANCTFNGTQNGIRIKSDNDRGGLVQNISYFNIGMTNVNLPIQVYGYYNEVGTPSSISPYYAATQAVASVSSTTPICRNITFSNINATSVSGYPIGVIWARTEMPATNIVFNHVNLTGNRNFCLYNVCGAQFIDCNLTTSSASNTFALFNADLVITNSAADTSLFKFEGLTTNDYASSFTFYNALGTLKNTNAFGTGPLTLSASTFTVSNNLDLSSGTVINYTLGTNAAQLAVTGNLTLGGTNTISAGAGFTNGTYTLMSYNGLLYGSLPALGSAPAGYGCTYNTNTAGLVRLTVVYTNLQAPAAPANLTASATNLAIRLTWHSVTGATDYNLKRGTVSGSYPTVFNVVTATNYADSAVTNGVNYYYVVTAVGAGGESTNSWPASAMPLPSNQPANLVMHLSGNQLQLSWPADHLGWRLEMQTNALHRGLGTNWVTVPNSTNMATTNLMLNFTNSSVFLRLVYP